MNKILEQIDNQKFSILDWILGFMGILFVRFILESISSPAPSGMMPTDPYTLIHYGLFFLTLLTGVMLIAGFYSKKYISSSKYLLFIFPIMWLAPLIDITLSRSGVGMSYIYDLPHNLALDFFKFFTFGGVSGITPGMYLQISVFYIFIAYFIWNSRKKLLPVVLGILSIYVFMFCLGSIPSILYAINTPVVGVNKIDITLFLNRIIINSNLFYNTLHESAISVTPFRFFQLGFDKLMSQILFVISVLLTALFFWKTQKSKMLAILKNTRPVRVIYYLTPCIIAIFYAYFAKVGNYNSWVDAMSLLCLLLSWFGMWMYSVHLNDVYDYEIDKITNKNRPIVKNEISPDEMQSSAYVYLFIALIGSWCAGFYTFFFVSVGLVVAYIYSVPPLRLRRLPIISVFLLSVVILSATLSGYFFVSENKNIHSFSTLYALGIILFYTLELNFKDMKDIEGDKKEGVGSIPVIFPNKGIKIVGALFALSFLLVPIFLSFYWLYIVSIPASVFGYTVITAKKYKEKKVFALHFVFIILVITIYYIGFSITK